MSDNLIKSADQTVEKLAKIVDHPYSKGNFVFYDCGLATISADDIRELLAEYEDLRAQLATARADAIEEAVMVCEDERNKRGCTKATDGLWTARTRIRALKETTPQEKK